MGSIDELNQRIKISRYCPFKTSIEFMLEVKAGVKANL
jgi:hypothetical protein